MRSAPALCSSQQRGTPARLVWQLQEALTGQFPGRLFSSAGHPLLCCSTRGADVHRRAHPMHASAGLRSKSHVACSRGRAAHRGRTRALPQPQAPRSAGRLPSRQQCAEDGKRTRELHEPLVFASAGRASPALQNPAWATTRLRRPGRLPCPPQQASPEHAGVQLPFLALLRSSSSSDACELVLSLHTSAPGACAPVGASQCWVAQDLQDAGT